ncbi:MAG: hydrogenase iron-sulfur subunit [bacterium]|nr:hydrogenase iron-sulfur subunit [bacterium]
MAEQAPSLGQPVRAHGVLERLERGFLYLDRLVETFLPRSLNALHHTGAIAITALFVATVTGVLLLLWYRPSVHMSYSSVAAMSSHPWTAGLMRSLHRYSSDACVFFVLIHFLRVLFEGRFAGARWLAWVTGVITVGFLEVVGWSGYWLVWDARAQHIATGTARMLDVLPIVVDPMGRSFLFDEAVNSLLFFVVFFIHMLVPISLAIGLWLHLTRVSRSRFVTETPMTIWTLGLLMLLSVAYPATNAPIADLTALGQSFTMDWWYLMPLAFTDRLSGGALWSLALVVGPVLGTFPWWMTRGKPKPARVDPARCNECLQCYNDCPFEAITMIPRTEANPRYALQADVNPARCVGCGICSGSCDSIAIDLDWFNIREQRKKIEGWLAEAAERDEKIDIAVTCTSSAGGLLSIDRETGVCSELPGYRVLEAPCAGWLHPLTLERALRRGADRAIIIGCGGECHYREGTDWLNLRLSGERNPTLRTQFVERERISTLFFDRTRKAEMIRVANTLHDDGTRAASKPLSTLRMGLAFVTTAVITAMIIGLVSDLNYSAPQADGSQLVVTFKHPGQMSEDCHELSEEEKAALPVHMRLEKICDRGRSDVRLAVYLDGASVLERAYPPAGFWGDLNSLAIEEINVKPGEHLVGVKIGDSRDPDEWTFVAERKLTFGLDKREVVAFDRLAGFKWY